MRIRPALSGCSRGAAPSPRFLGTSVQSPPRVTLRFLPNRRTLWFLGLLALTTSRLDAGDAEPGLNPARLRVQILDAASQQPTACSISLVDAKGRLVIEHGAYTAGFRAYGRFEKWVPPGRTRLRITRGFETAACERELDLPVGSETNLVVALQRAVDLRQRGWYAGDSHAHMIHGEKTLPVDFPFVALSAHAEDLRYLSLAQEWAIAKREPEMLAAELSRLSTPDCQLTWNLEEPKNYYLGDAGRCLGHGWTLALRGRTRTGGNVIDLLLNASAADYESTKPSFANFESHQLIHAQRGRVFYTHPARWWMGEWGGQGGYPHATNMRVSNLAVELPLDTLIGPTYDGVDVITGTGEPDADAKAFALWAMLLNHGYRLAATASSDACFDRPGGATPGAARTYAFAGKRFSLDTVAHAIAKGSTFATTGPLILATVDGQPPGTAFTAGSRARSLELEAWASGADTVGLSRVEILRNGGVCRVFDFGSPLRYWHTNLVLSAAELSQPGWYCVRVFGKDVRRQRAITGAFFFNAPDFKLPRPVPMRVQVRLEEAGSGRPLSGTLTEIEFWGSIPHEGKPHHITGGIGSFVMSGTMRLCARVAGYEPAILSPLFDNPPLIAAVTRLEDQDLVNWSTFERIRELLGEVKLTFVLPKKHSAR
jgi:hypothetical protein